MTRMLRGALIIARVCAIFRLHATSQENRRYFFFDRDVFRRCRPSACRRVVRQQDKEECPADAAPDDAETSQEFKRAKEKRGCREAARSKAIGHSREISVTFLAKEEKRFRKSLSSGEVRAGRVFREEKAEIFADAGTRIFSQ